MSKNDEEIHFITSSQLINLYRINPKKYIIIVSNNWQLEGIHITPLFEGNYREESERLGIL